MGTAPLASEQAINRLSERLAGFPSEQGNNREVSARASKVLSRSGRAAMEVATKEDPTAVVRVAI